MTEAEAARLSKPVLFLMGPTAAGKTDVAMRLIEEMPIDIISVDSAMIYKDMDIGTAKPSTEELTKAPHALIDFLDPAETWSVGEFCTAAHKEIERSHRQQRIPLLTGGTMMYFRALEQGLAILPTGDEQVRNRIDAIAQRQGWPAVHQQLADVDAEAAARIHPNDAQRIQRALEVYKLTGVPLSELQRKTAKKFPYPLQKFAILYDDRDVLHDRIARRLEIMMEQGFLSEVQSLYEREDLHSKLPSIRSVGYRQIWQFLEGAVSLEQAKENAKTATRQLAKRQMTWIRSEQNLHGLSGDGQVIADEIVKMWGNYY